MKITIPTDSAETADDLEERLAAADIAARSNPGSRVANVLLRPGDGRYLAPALWRVLFADGRYLEVHREMAQMRAAEIRRERLAEPGTIVERDGRHYRVTGQSPPFGCLCCIEALDDRLPRVGVIANHAVSMYRLVSDTANIPRDTHS